MCRVLEFGQRPKLLPCQYAADKIGYIVPHLVVRHRALYNRVTVGFAAPAIDDKIYYNTIKRMLKAFFGAANRPEITYLQFHAGCV